MRHRLTVDRKTGRVYVYVNGKLTSLKLWMAHPDEVRWFMNSSMSAEEGYKKLEELQERGEVEYDSQ